MILIVFSFFVSPLLYAQSLPLWELGIASGYAFIPYYPGSASNREVLLPMPLAIYRGEKNKAINAAKRFKLTPSFALGLPVPEGGEAGVRRFMSGLDGTVQFGPRLSVDLGRNASINFPLRAVSSISSHAIGMQGWVFAPYLHYAASDRGVNGWKLNVAIGPQYASTRFHEYYYGVSNKYDVDGRASYKANAGYSGSRITVYSQKSINRLWLSGFARYDYLAGASFIDSPLVEKESSLFAGFVVGWVFAKSPQRVSLMSR